MAIQAQVDPEMALAYGLGAEPRIPSNDFPVPSAPSESKLPPVTANATAVATEMVPPESCHDNENHNEQQSDHASNNFHNNNINGNSRSWPNTRSGKWMMYAMITISFGACLIPSVIYASSLHSTDSRPHTLPPVPPSTAPPFPWQPPAPNVSPHDPSLQPCSSAQTYMRSARVQRTSRRRRHRPMPTPTPPNRRPRRNRPSSSYPPSTPFETKTRSPIFSRHKPFSPAFHPTAPPTLISSPCPSLSFISYPSNRTRTNPPIWGEPLEEGEEY
mmetsp:Transcript_13098/g.27547  ORF Transcript_13098/g.27547 Transcript_13098/m.27547 type:complete len:273 (-) Transcript_13098:166-984(-)